MRRYKNYIINGLIIVAFVGGLILMGGLGIFGDGEGGTVKASTLYSVHNTYDFGNVSMADGHVTHTFSIDNTNPMPVTVKRIYTSCMCTEASFIYQSEKKGPFGMQGHGPLPKVNQTIAPGESADILVDFDPAAHGPAGVGPIDRTVFIETSDGGRMALQISANVTP